MFTKLSTQENNNVLYLETEEGEKLNKALTHLTVLRQEEMLAEATKIRKFAARLGLDESKLETGIEVKGRNRVITLRFVDDEGVEIGSTSTITGRGYTFGTIYPSSVEAKSTNGLQRVLQTITNWEFALNTAKDSLLNLACQQWAGAMVA